MNTPFLKQVARVYASNERDSLLDYCFVFPNKRSATFFSSFLDEELDSAALAPATMTISDFVASFSDKIEANRYEQLFTLFNEYSRLPEVDIDFDRFLFWGEMLISDFNDVDRYLVDPKALFVNVKRLKEISANYLTPEQQKVIERFWGEKAPMEHVKHFWKHLDYNDEAGNQTKFLKLWEVLLPLYNSFNETLARRGLASSGHLYRKTVEALAGSTGEELPFRRYIFVGFNVLSTSEISMFSSMMKLDMADFYWDFNSPALRMPDNRARRFIARNIEEFPSRYKLDESNINTIPNIHIIGIPSATGQVKAACSQIERWVKDGSIQNTANAVETAVVLPDESLFIPLIHSMPEQITSLNVTMGFPMKLSPVATLLRSIISLQLRMRRNHGELSFFYEDVKPLLSAPLIMKADPEGCNAVSEEIAQRRLYQIPATEISRLAPKLERVFVPLGNLARVGSVEDYIFNLCEFLAENLDETDRLGRHFIQAYREAVKKLCEAAEEFGVDLSGFALFQLVERAVNSDSVNFIGEPLAGLQVMGVLETRALDFENIIMLSMNERVFPRKHYTRSFIPDALRRGYGMATLDFQESIFAYYFYRLISRARNVTLIYDARRVGGARSNEISRYPAQLLYMFGEKGVRHSLGIYNGVPSDILPVSVTKDDRIMQKLMLFTAEGSDRKLSASSINTYINCPLEFYLRYVEDYSEDEEIADYVDFSTFGNILHEVMQRFYESFQAERNGKKLPVEISEEMLSRVIDSPGNIELDRLITSTINKCFNRLPKEKQLTPLAGETLVLSRVFKEAVLEMLRIDRRSTPFTFVAAEKKMKCRMRVNDDLTVNVTQIVDRIDITDGQMRFVDYKTGDDMISSPSVDALFNGDNPQRAKALMQLLFYCHVYRHCHGDSRPITPVVYKMRSIMKEGVRLSSIGVRKEREEIRDYNQVYAEFEEALNKKIAEIFNPAVPFTQAGTEHSCKFCQFKSICLREED